MLNVLNQNVETNVLIKTYIYVRSIMNIVKNWNIEICDWLNVRNRTPTLLWMSILFNQNRLIQWYVK